MARKKQVPFNLSFSLIPIAIFLVVLFISFSIIHDLQPAYHNPFELSSTVYQNPFEVTQDTSTTPYQNPFAQSFNSKKESP